MPKIQMTLLEEARVLSTEAQKETYNKLTQKLPKLIELADFKIREEAFKGYTSCNFMINEIGRIVREYHTSLNGNGTTDIGVYDFPELKGEIVARNAAQLLYDHYKALGFPTVQVLNDSDYGYGLTIRW